ncbi:hypothetical protein BJ912DRAFT_128140 [Pholiota molesta]|nr:hypothetical protein BJ912DRAFT_128140 [Pholiota molesta]
MCKYSAKPPSPQTPRRQGGGGTWREKRAPPLAVAPGHPARRRYQPAGLHTLHTEDPARRAQGVASEGAGVVPARREGGAAETGRAERDAGGEGVSSRLKGRRVAFWRREYTHRMRLSMYEARASWKRKEPEAAPGARSQAPRAPRAAHATGSGWGRWIARVRGLARGAQQAYVHLRTLMDAAARVGCEPGRRMDQAPAVLAGRGEAQTTLLTGMGWAPPARTRTSPGGGGEPWRRRLERLGLKMKNDVQADDGRTGENEQISESNVVIMILWTFPRRRTGVWEGRAA